MPGVIDAGREYVKNVHTATSQHGDKPRNGDVVRIVYDMPSYEYANTSRW